jgi:hypothetical protein
VIDALSTGLASAVRAGSAEISRMLTIENDNVFMKRMRETGSRSFAAMRI